MIDMHKITIESTCRKVKRLKWSVIFFIKKAEMIDEKKKMYMENEINFFQRLKTLINGGNVI